MNTICCSKSASPKLQRVLISPGAKRYIAKADGMLQGLKGKRDEPCGLRARAHVGELEERINE